MRRTYNLTKNFFVRLSLYFVCFARQEPTVGIHVRRTDKLDREAKRVEVEDNMEKVTKKEFCNYYCK